MYELKQIILAIVSIVDTAQAVTAEDSKKGKRVTIGEWVDIAKTAGKAVPAFAGLKAAAEKIKTLTGVEKSEIVQFVRTELDLRNDVAEVVTGAGIDAVLAIYLMIKGIQSVKNG